jgi:Protein of unknown function (DUF998)
MAKQTIPAPALLARPIRALLACGAVAGPMYVAVTAAQALTRDGFDLSRHPFNALTAGDLGWIHRTNLFLAGVLTVLFAVGVGRVLRPGRGARWGPRLLGLYGLGLMIGGVFSSNPVSGFPPGTSPETTWHGMVHVAARGSGYVVLIAASLVIAGGSPPRGAGAGPGFPGQPSPWRSEFSPSSSPRVSSDPRSTCSSSCRSR